MEPGSKAALAVLLFFALSASPSLADVFSAEGGITKAAAGIGVAAAGLGAAGLSAYLASQAGLLNSARAWVLKNSTAIKQASDAAGWVSLGMFVAGALLTATGVGAPVGVALMAGAFAVGVGSGVADVAVSGARMQAGLGNADDKLRLGLAPLAFVPAGKVAAQPGKLLIKTGAKELAKSGVLEKTLFRGTSVSKEFNIINKLKNMKIGRIDDYAVDNYFRSMGKSLPKRPDISLKGGKMNIELKEIQNKLSYKKLDDVLKHASNQLNPKHAVTVGSKGIVKISKTAKNIIHVDASKVKSTISNGQVKSIAQKTIKSNPHVSKILVKTKSSVVKATKAMSSAKVKVKAAVKKTAKRRR